jgi:hypothetical protein
VYQYLTILVNFIAYILGHGVYVRVCVCIFVNIQRVWDIPYQAETYPC